MVTIHKAGFDSKKYITKEINHYTMLRQCPKKVLACVTAALPERKSGRQAREF